MERKFNPSRRPVSIERSWQAYRNIIMPHDASPSDIIAAKRAFFSGASVIWYGLFMGLDNGTGEPTEADMKLMNQISDELDKWGKKFDAEIFAENGGLQ